MATVALSVYSAFRLAIFGSNSTIDSFVHQSKGLSLTLSTKHINSDLQQAFEPYTLRPSSCSFPGDSNSLVRLAMKPGSRIILRHKSQKHWTDFDKKKTT
jgi:hypothetical protein